jgi:Beta-glucosidase-related glycosidases
MTSYNRINGVPASCNSFLLDTLLREEWGFDGFVVSDCGAVADVYGGKSLDADGRVTAGHAYAKSLKEASAMTLNAGCDMSCGAEHKYNLLEALREGLVSEGTLDRALIRIFTSRMRLGLFDDSRCNPFAAIDKSCVCSGEHAALAEKMAEDTIVLLKNNNHLLPLQTETLKTILVVGPNAIYRELGGYSAGSISKVVDTPVNVLALEGIKNVLSGTGVEVLYEKGWCSGREYKENALELLPGAEIGGSDGEGAFDPQTVMQGVADVLGPNVTLESLGVAFMSPERYVPVDPDKKADTVHVPLFHCVFYIVIAPS